MVQMNPRRTISQPRGVLINKIATQIDKAETGKLFPLPTYVGVSTSHWVGFAGFKMIYILLQTPNIVDNNWGI